jgi:hypothetical protein
MILAVSATQAEVLDRIAVTVGKQVVAESEILRDLRVSAFIDGKPVDLSPTAKRKSADRLVEEILILQEAADSHITLSIDEDLARMLAQVKSPYTSADDYAGALSRYGISEKDVAVHLTLGLRTLRFTDLRFRPAIQIQEQDLRAYYEQLKAQARGANPALTLPSFDDSRDQIETLLTGQRVEDALNQWLVMARTETPIVYRSQVVP